MSHLDFIRNQVQGKPKERLIISQFINFTIAFLSGYPQPPNEGKSIENKNIPNFCVFSRSA